MTYKVVVTREGGQWMADVPSVPGAHTFASSLGGLRRSVREVIVLMEDLPDYAEPDVELRFEVDEDAVRAAVELAERREALARAEAALRTQTFDAIRALKAAGHSVRDVAALVGVTPGRVSQIAPETSRGEGPRDTLARSVGASAPRARLRGRTVAPNRNVVPNPEGGWDVKGAGTRRSAHADTQAEAVARAKQIVGNAGGGEVSIHGRDGKIRAKDTVDPGNDPRNIPG